MQGFLTLASDSAIGTFEESKLDWIPVGNEAELRRNGRKTALIADRKVTVFCQDDSFYALDFHCYHAGGPLDLGNIEDVNGISCVVCPWHKYKISLAKGEGFYQAIDLKNPRIAPTWRSKGVKQRTHSAKVHNEMVYVKISTSTTKHDSDYYYSEKYKTLLSKTDSQT